MKALAFRLAAVVAIVTGLLVACATPGLPPAVRNVQPTETPTIGSTVVNRTASVRRAPHASAARIFTLRAGTRVRYYGHQNGWTLIRLRKGRGWVRSHQLGLRRARVSYKARPARRRPRGLGDLAPRAERRGDGRLDIPVPRSEPTPEPAVDAIDVEPCEGLSDCPATGGGAVVLPGGS